MPYSYTTTNKVFFLGFSTQRIKTSKKGHLYNDRVQSTTRDY